MLIPQFWCCCQKNQYYRNIKLDWVLGSSHLFKYRLHYQGNGADYVRYDNERCKGDHRHIGSMEEPYLFESVKKLVQDFYGDIKHARATGGISWIGISK
jgi:hypothetical protein